MTPRRWRFFIEPMRHMRAPALVAFVLAQMYAVTADETITRSYHEMKEKAAYDVIGCGVCKGMPTFVMWQFL